MNQPQIPYFRAPEGLRARIESAVRRAPTGRRAVWRPAAQLIGVAAALVLTAAGTWTLGNRSGASDPELASVLSGHLRSLTPSHLTDVASSDQHTVKPWFAGRLDFSPPVVDPAREGFPLVGGRLDFVAGQPAAVLVYTRRSHIINVFVQPLEAGQDVASVREDRRGYNVLRWSAGGMKFWAVSDLNVPELERFRDLLTAGATAPGPR